MKQALCEVHPNLSRFEFLGMPAALLEIWIIWLTIEIRKSLSTLKGYLLLLSRPFMSVKQKLIKTN